MTTKYISKVLNQSGFYLNKDIQYIKEIGGQTVQVYFLGLINPHISIANALVGSLEGNIPAFIINPDGRTSIYTEPPKADRTGELDLGVYGEGDIEQLIIKAIGSSITYTQSDLVQVSFSPFMISHGNLLGPVISSVKDIKGLLEILASRACSELEGKAYEFADRHDLVDHTAETLYKSLVDNLPKIRIAELHVSTN